MNKSVYVGIDPSYTKTGVTYIDTEQKTIYFKAVSPIGSNKTYGDALLRAEYIAQEILSVPTNNINQEFIIEEPLVTSQMSSRLGILSGVVGITLVNHMKQETKEKTLHTVNPNVVATTNRKLRGYTSKTRKNISREITHKYLQVFEEHGYNIVILNDKFNKDGTMKQRVLSTDEAESFIMALILMRHKKALPRDIETKIVNLNRGLNADITVNNIEIKENENVT